MRNWFQLLVWFELIAIIILQSTDRCQAPNKVVKEWLMKQGYDCIKLEYAFGNSRMDRLEIIGENEPWGQGSKGERNLWYEKLRIWYICKDVYRRSVPVERKTNCTYKSMFLKKYSELCNRWGDLCMIGLFLQFWGLSADEGRRIGYALHEWCIFSGWIRTGI